MYDWKKEKKKNACLMSYKINEKTSKASKGLIKKKCKLNIKMIKLTIIWSCKW